MGFEVYWKYTVLFRCQGFGNVNNKVSIWEICEEYRVKDHKEWMEGNCGEVSSSTKFPKFKGKKAILKW